MANTFTSGSDLYRQTDERLWFQNPIQALSPDIIRPFSWSQVPSRLALYEDDSLLPQQSAGASNILMDLRSPYNSSLEINENYNFDVQQNSTSFVYNSNNVNNTVQVSYTTQNLINNNITNNTNLYGGGTVSGATGTVVSLSNPIWDNSLMTVTFTSVTNTFSNGLITSITNNAPVVFTLAKLKTLSDGYDTGLTSSDTFGSGVSINVDGTMLEQNYDTWTFSNGLVTAIELEDYVGDISELAECDP